MKNILLLVACLSIAGLSSLVDALPPREILRFRRDAPVVIKNIIRTNPSGGQDVSLSATKGIGNEKANAFGTVSAQGNTKTGGAITGATLGVNGPGISGSITKASSDIGESLIKTAQANLYRSDLNSIDAKFTQTDNKLKGFDLKSQEKSGNVAWSNAYGVGASVSRDINKGVSDTLTKSLSANIFNNNKHNLDATIFNSHIKQDNGFNFQKTGGILDYSHAGGHGLNAGLTRFSGVGDRANVGGYSNLFTSNDCRTKLNANAGASQWLNGPFGGQRDFGFGLGLSHNGWLG